MVGYALLIAAIVLTGWALIFGIIQLSTRKIGIRPAKKRRISKKRIRRVSR